MGKWLRGEMGKGGFVVHYSNIIYETLFSKCVKAFCR